MKLKCMIVDDEPLAIDVIEAYLIKYPDFDVCARAQNALEASEIMKATHVDLMFLDIYMPEIDGINFLKGLKNPPIVIFTTAYREYALEGFELNALDYLLKPIAPTRFDQAIQKVKEYVQLREKDDETQSELGDDALFIKADQKQQKISFAEIRYVEAFADYVKIYTNERRVVTLQTMKNMEQMLPTDRFCRVHRSFIVALNRISAYSGTQIEVDAVQIPLGKNFKVQFNHAMEQFRGNASR